MTRFRSRRGFALITVLWVLGLAGGVVLTAVLDGRLAVDAARHRIATTRGNWQTRGCLARIRSVVAGTLGRARDELAREYAWRAVGAAVDGVGTPPLGLVAGACTLATEPFGVRVDMNVASAETLAMLIVAADAQADAPSLVAALLDWRDQDGTVREGGAEAEWYARQGRIRPTDGPFRAREELRAVRGFEAAESIAALLDVESARIALLHAPPAILATLPGFDAEAVAFVVARRRWPTPVRDLHALIAEAPVRVRARLSMEFAALSERATLTPDAWVIAAAVDDGSTGNRVVVEQVLRRSGAQVVVTRERTW